jgi:hypothetical protein
MPEIVLSVNQSKKDQIYLLTKRQIQSAISNSCFSATDVFVKKQIISKCCALVNKSKNAELIR